MGWGLSHLILSYLEPEYAAFKQINVRLMYVYGYGIAAWDYQDL
jgi:hypothetical protein